MRTLEERTKFINITPDTSVDTVLVSIHNDQLQVLVTKRTDNKNDPFPNYWGLPGVYFNIKEDNTIIDAAVRGLKQKAHLVQIPYLETLEVFCNQDRDPRWHTLTVVNIGYVNYNSVNISSDDVKWLSEEEILSSYFAFDHKDIILFALNKVKDESQIKAKIINFLDNFFTQPELQKLYETVLNVKLDKSSFRKQIRESNLLIETDEFLKPKRGKPAILYSVNPSFDINKNWFFPRSVAKNT